MLMHGRTAADLSLRKNGHKRKPGKALFKDHDLGIRIAKAIHFITVIVLFTVCRCMFFCPGIGISALREQAPSVILFTISAFALIRILNAYPIGLLEIREIITAQQLVLFLSLSLIGLLDLLESGFSARAAAFLGVDLALTFAWNVIWSLAADHLYQKYIPRKAAVFVCADPSALDRLKTAFSAASCFRIEKTITADPASSMEALADALLPYHAVLTAGLPHRLQNALVEYCTCSGKECFLLPCVGDIVLACAMPMQSLNVLAYRANLPAGKPEY